MKSFPHLTRRGFVIAGAAALSVTGTLPATPGCTLIGEQEEGPYYVDDETLRSDVTEGKPGVPLALEIALVNSRTCQPLGNAAIDIWHCDASGVYSGFTANSPDGGPGGPGGRGGRGPFGQDGFGRPPGPPPGPPPDGQGMMPPPPGMGRGGMGRGRGPRNIDSTRFLRGVQLTDKRGVAAFQTLYPGWYSGRTIHVHLKVHIGGEAAAKYSGGHVAHTGQLFFPEDLTERIAKLDPYAKRLGIRRTLQQEDGIFTSQHGAAAMLKMEHLHAAKDAEGFRATITLGVDPDATPAPVGIGGGGPGGRGFGRGRG
jgi:protocatechuate 3,4-dioxygenase beta subunit